MTWRRVDAMHVSSDDFRFGMRHLAAAVNIVSSLQDGEPRGLLATAVCSVSAEPPLLLVCINRSASLYNAITGSGRFCVNALRANQHALARNFLNVESKCRFDGLGWTSLSTGAPAIDGALINFDCEVEQAVTAGTHMIFVGQVVATRCEGETDPLLYFRSGYAGLGGLPEDGVPMGAG